MTKDQAYYEAAIEYNRLMAAAAAETAEKVGVEPIAGWCRGIQKQHLFHQDRHQTALKKFLVREAQGLPPLDEESVEKTDYRSASTGKYVTEEFAHDNPDTTVSETTQELQVGGEIDEVYEPNHNHDVNGETHPDCEACGTTHLQMFGVPASNEGDN